jgi:sugar O-acyltransferase (sialic acid O-acetyltransferase NeuD family)
VSEPAKPIGRVEAPLVNPNEPESQVVELPIEPYSPIARGDAVCTVETSKATFVVESEHDGFVGSIHVSLGDHVVAGQLICEIFDRLPERAAPATEDATASGRPAGLKLTKKAERLAVERGIDLSTLPTNRFLTERDIEALLPHEAPAVMLDESIATRVHEQAAVVFGGGGFAKSLIDLMRSAEAIEPLCVVDDAPSRTGDVLGAPVIGGREYLTPLRSAGVRLAVNAVGAIGRIQDRVAIFHLLEGAGFQLPTLVDPAAFVAESATLAPGAQVFAGALVCSAATVGKGTIVNSGAIVSHDCRIGDHSHIAPGAILAGEVEVGDVVLVGMGVTARVGLRIGSGAVIGNSCVLREDVPAGTILSAGSVWPRA